MQNLFTIMVAIAFAYELFTIFNHGAWRKADDVIKDLKLRHQQSKDSGNTHDLVMYMSTLTRADRFSIVFMYVSGITYIAVTFWGVFTEYTGTFIAIVLISFLHHWMSKQVFWEMIRNTFERIDAIVCAGLLAAVLYNCLFPNQPLSGAIESLYNV